MSLYSLGDELYPHEADPQQREDISMSEEASEVAEERRRRVREEILRRRSFFEACQKTKGEEEGQQQPLNNFDSVVDADSRLKSGNLDGSDLASSTAVNVASSASGLAQRQGRPNEQESTEPESVKDHLRTSDTLVDLTPTSEAPRDATHSEYFSTATESPQTAYGESEESVFYAHPDDVAPEFQSPFAGLHEQSSEPSMTDSFSHIGEPDASSDGTLSEGGHDGIATPASWSEVSSVVSDVGYQ